MTDPQLQTQAQQGAARQPSSAGAKVTVACNLPHGLRLRVFNMAKSRELVMGGGSRDVRIAEPVGEPILIHGIATEVGKLPRAPIVMGYALTHGVDKETWDAWLADNKTSAMVRNRCVFAYERTADAEDAAKELKGQLSGLQPFAIDGDPRAPRPRGELSSVTQDDEQRARMRTSVAA
jgi:hypothetical protein